MSNNNPRYSVFYKYKGVEYYIIYELCPQEIGGYFSEKEREIISSYRNIIEVYKNQRLIKNRKIIDSLEIIINEVENLNEL